MTDEDALLIAICDYPDEDTPRLAFADFLQEQGGEVNDAWAAFIRGRVRVVREPEVGGALADEVGVVRNDGWKRRWLDRLGVAADGLTWGVWERGFPELLSGTFPRVRDTWPRIAGRVPVRILMIGGVDTAAAEELCGWSGLRRVARLLLYSGIPTPGGRTINDPGLHALARCGALAGLVALEVGFLAATDAAVTALLDSPHLAGLESLRLSCQAGVRPLSPQITARLTARFGSNYRS
jgi:uncharacterized protein (TIGR02996 family)